jgi:hypothetical protein
MVTVLVLAVLELLVVPVQLAMCQPESAKAPLRLMVAPETYCPDAQPVELVGEAVGLLPLPVWVKVRA